MMMTFDLLEVHLLLKDVSRYTTSNYSALQGIFLCLIIINRSVTVVSGVRCVMTLFLTWKLALFVYN